MSDQPENAVVGAEHPMTLRDEQRALTRSRILSALRELIKSHHMLDITMAAVAQQAGVSEPTLYRHFPTKRDLFAALGSDLYAETTAGVALSSLDDLLGFLPKLYQQLADMEATARWNLAAPKDEAVRPAVTERLPILECAASDELDTMSPSESAHLMRALLLLTSPTCLLYWQDYLGTSVGEAAETASWMIRRLARP